jgi:hypothetical protein
MNAAQRRTNFRQSRASAPCGRMHRPARSLSRKSIVAARNRAAPLDEIRRSAEAPRACRMAWCSRRSPTRVVPANRAAESTQSGDNRAGVVAGAACRRTRFSRIPSARAAKSASSVIACLHRRHSLRKKASAPWREMRISRLAFGSVRSRPDGETWSQAYIAVVRRLEPLTIESAFAGRLGRVGCPRRRQPTGAPVCARPRRWGACTDSSTLTFTTPATIG